MRAVPMSHPEARTSHAGDKLRALVVEDDGAIRELLRLHLRLAGIDVIDVADGTRALELTETARFDLFVLDVMLPGFDGVTLCRAARAAPLNQDASILMLTARDTEADKVVGLESGADDYLTKPFGVREFIARVGAIMRRTRRPEGARPTPPASSSAATSRSIPSGVRCRSAARRSN
jgi:DNA-binding response OmpR family regulator